MIHFKTQTMNKSLSFIVALIVLCFYSCTVTESIVFDDQGGGKYLTTFDMSEVMKQMEDAFKGDDDKSADNNEEKEAGELMDSTMYFKDLMVEYKDSIATLSPEKREALDAVQDMYMRIQMNEDEGELKYGVGLDFSEIAELTNVQEKIRLAQSLNENSEQVDAMKDSPMGKFFGNDKNGLVFNYDENGFSRVTTVVKEEGDVDFNIDEEDASDMEMKEMFSAAAYIIEYTFPKKIKSVNLENAVISEDGKKVTAQVNWVDYLTNPKALDIKVEFENE